MKSRMHVCSMSALSLLLLTGLASPASAIELSIGRGISAIDLGSVGSDSTGLVNLSGMTDLGTRLGYRFGRFVPFIGADYASLSMTETKEECDYYSDSYDEHCTKHKSDGGVSLFTVQAGLRYLLSDPEAQKAHGYLVAAGYMVFPSSDIDDDVDDAVSDTSSYGLLGGAGIEYMFSPYLSLGGEVGLNHFSVSVRDDNSLALTQLYSSLLVTFRL